MKSLVLMKKVADFSDASMAWCCQESENSILMVNEVLNSIVTDALRVSALSEETLQAVDSLKEIINSLGSDKNRSNANTLAKAIHEIALENSEVNELVTPMLEALQFQDRVTQNIGNLAKMIKVYLQIRSELTKSGEEFSKVKELEFGNSLLNLTTMVSERDVIRYYINNLPEKEETTEDALFF